MLQPPWDKRSTIDWGRESQDLTLKLVSILHYSSSLESTYCLLCTTTYSLLLLWTECTIQCEQEAAAQQYSSLRSALITNTCDKLHVNYGTTTCVEGSASPNGGVSILQR